MSSPVTSETFFNRRSRCSFYKQENLYIKEERLLFTKVLNIFAKDTSKTFLEVFSKVFSTRKYTGTNRIYAMDKCYVKETFITSAVNISNFLDKNKVENILDSFIFKNRIKGSVGCVLPDKKLNIFFSFKNVSDTQKDLDFFNFNNYIYNKVKKTTNDCLVMSVPTDSYFKIGFNQNDYTMSRGFISSIIKNEDRRPGEYCLSCSNKCKPLFINGLDRLKAII